MYNFQLQSIKFEVQRNVPFATAYTRKNFSKVPLIFIKCNISEFY